MWHHLKAVTMWQATGTGVLMRMADTSGSEALVSLEVLDAGELYFRVWPHAPATVLGMAHSVPYTIRQEGDDLILESGEKAVRIHLTDGSIVLPRHGLHSTPASQGQPWSAWFGAD